MFQSKYSRAAIRLDQQGKDLWQVHTNAVARLAAGEDVILMSVGDPDLSTIERIIEHAVTSLYRGRTHYSPGRGEPVLRETIAAIETQASGRITVPDEIIIFPGATNAIYTVLACLLDTNDEMIVIEPSYVGYQGIFRAIGCNIVTVPSIPSRGFELDVKRVEGAVTDATRVLLLNTPGNPAGNVIPTEDLRYLASFCLERNIWLVCDEVYSMITFERKHVSARTAAETLDNIIVIDGLSKSHAMTGWRLGWAVAPLAVTDQLLNFTSATIFGCSQFIQDAAAFAMQNDGEYIQSITREYRTRRDYACDRIETIDGVTCHRPAAGMFLMVDVSKVAKNGFDFANRLLEQTGVSVLPGSGFGALTENYVRLSLTHGIEVLEDALNRIEKFVEKSTKPSRE